VVLDYKKAGMAIKEVQQGENPKKSKKKENKQRGEDQKKKTTEKLSKQNPPE